VGIVEPGLVWSGRDGGIYFQVRGEVMKYCCDGFGQAATNSGKCGLSIAAKVDSAGKPFFLLVYRSASLEDEHDLAKAMEGSGYMKKACLATEQSILFCPWCGQELRRFYARDWGGIAGGALGW